MLRTASAFSQPFLARSAATRSMSPVSLAHPVPAAQRSIIFGINAKQRKEALELQKKDPVSWTPTKLAEHFKVPTAAILASVPLPTRREWKFHRKTTKEFPQFDKNRAKTESQLKIDNWINAQIAKLPEHRETKRRWHKTATHELKVNTDLRWLKSIENRLGGLQQKSLDKVAENRRRRAQAS